MFQKHWLPRCQKHWYLRCFVLREFDDFLGTPKSDKTMFVEWLQAAVCKEYHTALCAVINTNTHTTNITLLASPNFKALQLHCVCAHSLYVCLSVCLVSCDNPFWWFDILYLWNMADKIDMMIYLWKRVISKFATLNYQRVLADDTTHLCKIVSVLIGFTRS